MACEGGVNEKIDKVFSDGSAMWGGWRMIELMRDFVGECAGSCSVGRLWKR